MVPPLVVLEDDAADRVRIGGVAHPVQDHLRDRGLAVGRLAAGLEINAFREAVLLLVVEHALRQRVSHPVVLAGRELSERPPVEPAEHALGIGARTRTRQPVGTFVACLVGRGLNPRASHHRGEGRLEVRRRRRIGEHGGVRLDRPVGADREDATGLGMRHPRKRRAERRAMRQSEGGIGDVGGDLAGRADGEAERLKRRIGRRHQRLDVGGEPCGRQRLDARVVALVSRRGPPAGPRGLR